MALMAETQIRILDLAEFKEIAKKADEEIAALKAKVSSAQALVRQQAEDPGLWFTAGTAFEAYLQQEMKRLHAVIEEQTQ